MDNNANETILSIVTTNKNLRNDSVPIFYVETKEELENKSLIISKCLGAMVHDIGDNVFIIVKH